jgi:hypothetical protein
MTTAENHTADVPSDLAALARRLPDVDAIKSRLEATKRETAFLRKLLKLSVQAKRATEAHPCK